MNDLQIIENNNQRVMTTAMLAECYETTDKHIKQNFNNNKERYIEGKHFYCLTGDTLRTFKSKVENFDLAANVNKLYLWTEKGALLHAKSLNTDKAWEVYDYLVENYFKKKEELPTGNNLIALAVIEAQKLLAQKDKELEIKNQLIGELKPKADYTDRILQNPGLVNINQIAKDYGISARTMNKLLAERGIQYKQGNQWLLYKKYQDKGYTSSETINITRTDGSPDIVMRTKWTQKGRLFIYELLKKDGIKPVIETEFNVTA